jgi:ferricrocin synthase
LQTIEYLGRKDDQTKIRGQRLELAEVTEAVRAAAPIQASVVSLVVRHPELPRDLLLSFIAQGTKRKTSLTTSTPSIIQSKHGLLNSITNTCRQRLPAFMVPDLLIMLDYIPLADTSGKADAKLLRRLVCETPFSTFLSQESTDQRGFTAREDVVLSILRSILGSELTAKPSTRTFELGIDSLSAITLSFRLRAAGFDTTLPFLLRGPTIEEIASHEQEEMDQDQAASLLDQYDNAFRSRVIPLFPAYKVTRIMPCMPLQTSMIIRSLDSETPAYVNHFIFIVSTTDIGSLTRAIDDTMIANDILHTCFVRLEDEIVQVILADTSSTTWLQHTASEDALGDLRHSLHDISLDVQKSFSHQPPLRIGLWSDKSHTYMSLSLHHALYDGQLSLALSH